MEDVPFQAAPDYAVTVQSAGAAWAWVVRDVDGAPRARGEDASRDVAWRAGMLTAGALGAFERIGRRRF
ncbi:hypothetical protein [Caulobacter sp. 1776]|uniref:hypothetical protein n=1 Tax=Caulobacter sp. 1776 TaxID=3156420 RepID=UPI003392170B